MHNDDGLTLWLTGLSGSGKTTLAHALASTLRARGQCVVLLDGDVLRKGLCEDLGFSPEDRSENLRRAAHVARQINDSGVIAIVALISPYEQDRHLARTIHTGRPYREVYVSCPIEVCEARDPKGLYARARRGEIPGFTGLDSPFEEPQHPDVVCPTDEIDLDTCVERILTSLD
jgi:adenylyl-sulfate kinase